MAKLLCISLMIGLYFLAQLAASIESTSIVNDQVARYIHLNGHIAQVKYTIDFTAQKDEVEEYVLAIPAKQVTLLAFISAKSGNDDTLSIKRDGEVHNGFEQVTINLANKLSKGDSSKLQVSIGLVDCMTPFPAEVKQSEDQFVKYEDYLYAPSFYQTKSQTTKLKLPSSLVLSYTDKSPVDKDGSSITYGPFTNIKPLDLSEELSIHVKNNKPFATITDATREIEISHWGNVAVEEEYSLHHTGAKLKGGFSRIDYDRGQKGASFAELKAKLPSSAEDIYYRDIIGNVTTSSLESREDSIRMTVIPRFPIFGGWKTEWYMGFNVPTSTYLQSDGGSSYKLKVPFMPTLQGVVIKQAKIKIILPEGCTDIKVESPVTAKESRSVRYTYLDSPLKGRPVITLEAQNLIRLHQNEELVVTYKFERVNLLHEPLLTVGAFLFAFLIAIVAVRVDLRIGGAKAQMKLKTT